MEEQYPHWLLLRIFFDFLAENANKDVTIWGYSGFRHALHLLLTVLHNLFLLRRIADPLALRAAHTDAHYKNLQKLPSAAISSEVFLRTHPWHHQKNEQQQKLPVGTRCGSSFIFGNGRSKIKHATFFYILFRSI